MKNKMQARNVESPNNEINKRIEYLKTLPILDFVPAVNEGFDRPFWFSPYAEVLDTAVGAGHEIVFSAPPQFGKPLYQETKVTMGDGSLRKIKDVHVGDEVVSGAGRVTKVVAKFDQGELPCFRITTRGQREIIAEGSHRFLTQPSPPGSKRKKRGGWKRVDELNVYDRPTDNRGDGLVVLARYETKHKYLHVDEARFLGYIIGDGGCTTQTPTFTNIEHEIVSEFCRIVEEHFKGWIKKDGISYRVNSGRRPHHIRLFLEKHGVQGKGSKNKVVPEAVMSSQPEAVAAFIAAYFECDGTKTTGQASFSSVSKELLEGVQHLLARLGIRSALRVKNGRYKGNRHKSWRLSVYDEERFFKTIPIIGKKSRVKPNGLRGQPLREDGWLFDTITGIEPIGNRHCYCIMVKDDSSFLAEGCITHNSVLTINAILSWIIRRPDLRFGYGTYCADRARSVARDFRLMAERIGIEFSGTVMNPRTSEGGGVLFVGRGGATTGERINGFAVVDDPFKDDKEAQSATIREQTHRWYNKVWNTRIHPGASKIVMATRWHDNDLSGRLITSGYKYINIKAIAEKDDILGRPEGAPLSPHWPIDILEKIRKNDPATFETMYQGNPVVESKRVFSSVRFVDHLPTQSYCVGIGIDLAYSDKTASDFSTIVVVYKFDNKYYVADVYCEHVSLPKFFEVLVMFMRRYPGVIPRWYRGGFENGVGDLLNVMLRAEDLPEIEAIVVNRDKYQRAQKASIAWNAGNVFVLSRAQWTANFLAELRVFSGIGDAHDDQVDAFVAAFDSVEEGGSFYSMSDDHVWG